MQFYDLIIDNFQFGIISFDKFVIETSEGKNTGRIYKSLSLYLDNKVIYYNSSMKQIDVLENEKKIYMYSYKDFEFF